MNFLGLKITSLPTRTPEGNEARGRKCTSRKVRRLSEIAGPLGDHRNISVSQFELPWEGAY